MKVTITIGNDAAEFDVPGDLLTIPDGYMGNDNPDMDNLWRMYFLPAVVALIRTKK